MKRGFGVVLYGVIKRLEMNCVRNMDFKLSEDQQIIKDMVRKITVSEFAPKAAEIDQKEKSPSIYGQVIRNSREYPMGRMMRYARITRI